MLEVLVLICGIFFLWLLFYNEWPSPLLMPCAAVLILMDKPLQKIKHRFSRFSVSRMFEMGLKSDNFHVPSAGRRGYASSDIKVRLSRTVCSN